MESSNSPGKGTTPKVASRAITAIDEERSGTIHIFSDDTDLATVLAPEHAAEYADYRRLHHQYTCAPAKMRIIRKLDFRIIPILFLCYIFNGLDMSNAGNVKIYTFLEDTHMTDRQFNLTLTWYFFTFAALEAPSM